MRATSESGADVTLVVSARELRMLRSALIEAMEAIADEHSFRARVGAERSECEQLLREIVVAQRFVRGTPAGDAEGYSP